MAAHPLFERPGYYTDDDGRPAVCKHPRGERQAVQGKVDEDPAVVCLRCGAWQYATANAPIPPTNQADGGQA